MKFTLLCLLLLVVALAWMWPARLGNYPPGVLVAADPDQYTTSNGKTWVVKGYTVKALADYRIRARVLMTERYFFGRESDLSPVDFTLGWRRMSDQQVLDAISLYRQRRAFCYRPKGSVWPIPSEEINSQSANMHLIPADDQVLHDLRSVSEGDIIELRGYLVEVNAPDGWRWRSSLSRTDSGNGACELMWVSGQAVLPVTH
jgi:hypothetical protein